VGPLPVLYQHLIPPNKKALKKKSLQGPPLIHCGYVAEEEFLFEYARRHDLLQECLGIHEGETVLLELDTMYAAVKSILTELKISSIPIRLPVVAAHGGVTRVIALYNNYSMENIPTGEDIQELARYLGKEQEQPRWYFDVTRWRWN
jgi:hypothetical protein